MLLQDAPAPLDRVVLAVVWRQVDQLDLESMPIGERDKPFHELGAATGNFRTIVEFDLQACDAGVGRFSLAPPLIQTIGDEVAGLPGMAE